MKNVKVETKWTPTPTGKSSFQLSKITRINGKVVGTTTIRLNGK